jgi:hypothetical protein
VWLLLAPAAPADPSGLVGRYYLDEAAGGSTPDSSGNGLNAVRAGSPVAVSDGRFGGAFRFGGVNDAFAGDFPPLRPSTVTVAAWVRSASTPAVVKAVVAQGAAGGCSYSSYALYTGGSADAPGLRFYIWNGSAAVVSPAASNTMWDGAWHLVTGTYDGAVVRLYVDAQQVGAGTPTTGPIVYGLANNVFVIGNYAGNLGATRECTENTSFSGGIDEVRVFNRALGTTEIASLMTHSSGGSGGDPSLPPASPAPAPKPGSPARIRARMRMTWLVSPRAVTITSATLHDVPVGAKVRLVCKPCGIRQTITAKRNPLRLAKLRDRRLRRGQKVTVTITKRGFVGRVITRKVKRYGRTRAAVERAARRPFTQTHRCIPVGATKPAKKC